MLFEQSRWDLAEAEFRKELAEDPENALDRSRLALCLYRQDRDAEAETEARRAAASAPDMPFAHYVLAKVLHSLERLPEAEGSAREAIRLFPEESEFFGALAWILLDRNRSEQAVEAAEEGLALDPDCETCANVRAMALVRAGRAEEASRGIAGALAKNPENSFTHANQGWAMLHAGKPRDAAEHFREALRLEPGMEWAREGMVEALKARHTIYAIMLKYFLWMSRLSSKAQIGVLVGGYVAYRILRTIAKTNPSMAPFVTPLLVAYALFAFMTWIADPLFNLLLLFSRFGRYALSKSDRTGAVVFGSFLVSAAASAGCGLLIGSEGVMLLGIFFALGALLSAQTFHCPAGWRRLAMAAYSAAVAGSALAAILLSKPVSGNPDLAGISTMFVVLALVGIFFSSIAANALILSARR